MEPCGGTETKMQDLPNEILAEIFDNLQPLARQKVRSVCTSWNFVIGQLFPIALRYDTTPLLAKTKARFIELTIFGNEHTNSHNGLVYKSITTRLQKLVLHNTVFKSTHLQILRRATNLEELDLKSVSSKALMVVGPDMFGKMVNKYEHEFKNWLPSLKILRVEGNCCARVLKLLLLIVKNGKLVEFRTDCGIHPVSRNPDDVVMQHNEKPQILQDIIESNRPTLRTLHGLFMEFDFHRWQIDQTSNYCKIARLSLMILPNLTLHSIDLLRNLQDQKNLEKLGLRFWNSDIALANMMGIVYRVEDIEPVVNLTMDIISRNASTLTKITLTFSVKSWFRRASHLKNFDGVFGMCVSLKHLQLSYIVPVSERVIQQPCRYSYDPGQPGFTGLTTLPKSLKFLHLSFPILCTATGLRELDLHNLENLENMVLDPVVWFIFTDTRERINSLTINHVEQLKSKLPKLKVMSLNVANHGTKNIAAGKLNECKLVSPGLLEKYKKTLKLKRFEGIYLNIEF